ncbi:MAG: hypothetical protein AAF555_02255 [Verrucomicrobiota bacterium]
MKFRRSRNRSEEGGVLVFSLLVMLVSSFGMLAFVTLVQARGQAVNAMEEAIQRRTAQANAKVLATEYINRLVLPENGAADATLSFNSSWGTATITNANSSPHGITGGLSNQHEVSPAFGSGYAATSDITVNDGISDQSYNLLLASRAGQGTGELFHLHRSQAYPNSLATVDGLFRVYGGVRSWYAASAGAVSLQAQWYWSPEGFLPGMANLSGVQMIPSNFTNVSMTKGLTAVNRGYDGTLNVVRNNVAVENSLEQMASSFGAPDYVNGGSVDNTGAVTSDGAGTVEVRLQAGDQLSHVLIEGNTSTLVLRGQTNSSHLGNEDAMPPLYIVGWDNQTGNRLTRIELEGQNVRPLILAYKRWDRGNVVVDAPQETWRGYGYFENCQLDFAVSGNGIFLWKGGLHTDSDVDVTGGIVEVVPEDNPTKAAAAQPLLPRYAWAELILDSP